MKTTVGMLTYKTHLDKEVYREWLRGRFTGNNLKIAIAHESGDEECPYLHTHVVVHFGKSTTISNSRVRNGFDFLDIHPNWKRCKGRGAWDDALRYISKEDKDVGFDVLEGFEVTINKIWECETESDALRLCTGPSDVIPYLNIFKHKCLAFRHAEYAEEIRNLELNMYQVIWWSILREQNDRQILWIVDYEGGMGKSTFGKWLRVNHNAIRLGNNTRDASHVYGGEEYVFFDFVRTQEERISYQVIEEIKGGDIYCGKYEGKSVLYAPPKVCVFSNFYPDRSKMTSDRWYILEYGERGAPTNIQESPF